MIRNILFAALAAMTLAACDNNSATLDTNAYYAEQEQLLVEAPTTEMFDTQPSVVQPVQQPVIIQQDDGFDLGDAAIGFVAAELIDEVGDAFESKHKKTYVAAVKQPVIKKVTPYQAPKKPVVVKPTVVKPSIVETKPEKKEGFFKKAVKKVKKVKRSKRRK
ncbi:hypothetical protein KVP40.0149 [Vibrio phage KVP40]|uniref:Lipoprotein n=1 Tax=Vibrio phage KVP40 (isolate Vibrio parahaemolyticus/Japan/Matsuzaki/1991) TaxID=75320 RepID=Q6WI05_BPKVM|nr:hypothetical protein KVP40.0149 [Vibrio phage KVP40]AAQ64218.1 hypothetical protein KVP40.0149 [Vibrio phage KVP40]